MRRQRADVKEVLFEALLRQFSAIHPAWSVPVAVIFLAAPALCFQHTIRIAGAPFMGMVLGVAPAILSLAAGVAGWKLRRERMEFLEQHMNINWLHRLSWKDFGQLVAEAYRQGGYEVEQVEGGADSHVDLRLRRSGASAIVQCERCRVYKVGVKPVREFYAALAVEKAGRAIFITSGVYTEEALQFAQGKALELVDGVQLAGMLHQRRWF